MEKEGFGLCFLKKLLGKIWEKTQKNRTQVQTQNATKKGKKDNTKHDVFQLQLLHKRSLKTEWN